MCRRLQVPVQRKGRDFECTPSSKGDIFLENRYAGGVNGERGVDAGCTVGVCCVPYGAEGCFLHETLPADFENAANPSSVLLLLAFLPQKQQKRRQATRAAIFRK